MQAEYTQGFIDKCAEFGIDPEALVKSALNPMTYARAGLKGLKAVLPAAEREGLTGAALSQRVGRSTISPNATLHQAVKAIKAPNPELARSSMSEVNSLIQGFGKDQARPFAKHVGAMRDKLGINAAARNRNARAALWKQQQTAGIDNLMSAIQ